MTARLAPAWPCLLSLVACAATSPAPGPADGPELLLRDVRLLGREGPQAVLVRGERIVSVVEVDQSAGLIGPTTRVLEGRGGLLLPGFHDAHAHPLGGALAREQLDLSECASVAEVQSALRAWAAAHPARGDDDWIRGGKWSYDLVPEGTFPTATDLDAAVRDRPVVLISYDGHSAWGNGEALRRAGIGADAPDPAGGRIVRDPEGRPTGVLLEGASALLERAVPPLPRAAQRRALREALGWLLALGITSIGAMSTSPQELELLLELEAAGELPQRVTAWLPWEQDPEQVAALRARHQGRVRIGGVKGFLDGVIESRTALLLEDYAGHPGERGRPLLEPAAVEARVGEWAARGIPIAFHAIGDGAARLGLDAFERAGRGLRHRLEHLEVVHPDDLPRFARLGVIASMQPHHAIPIGPDPDQGAWSEGLGPARLPRSFPWRALRDAGATLAFGSDWDVFSPDPLRGLAVAVTRQDEQGHPPGGWQAHQRLRFEEAAAAYAQGAAFAVGREQELGQVAPGFLADLVLLDPAVRPEEPATLWTGKVRVVIVGGRVLRGE